jgi:hypothetical protein
MMRCDSCTMTIGDTRLMWFTRPASESNSGSGGGVRDAHTLMRQAQQGQQRSGVRQASGGVGRMGGVGGMHRKQPCTQPCSRQHPTQPASPPPTGLQAASQTSQPASQAALQLTHGPHALALQQDARLQPLLEGCKRAGAAAGVHPPLCRADAAHGAVVGILAGQGRRHHAPADVCREQQAGMRMGQPARQAGKTGQANRQVGAGW